MSRVYTSYSEEEFALISNECEQYGMTPSAFQKYCVLLYLGQNAEEIKKIDIEEMKQIMNQELNNKKVGDKFIVSALLPPEKWSNLNRSQKITLYGMPRRESMGILQLQRWDHRPPGI